MIDQFPAQPVRVVVADDHLGHREALSSIVASSPRLALVGAASDGWAACELVGRHAPCVAVLDLHTPGSGPAAVRRIRRLRVPARILFLCEAAEDRTVFDALAAGGDGCVSKEATPHELLDAILTVAGGRSVLAPEVGARLVPVIRARARERQLSEPEGEILRYMAAGMPVAEMAERLEVSPASVRTHINRVYGILGVSDRGEAVAAAMRRRLIA